VVAEVGAEAVGTVGSVAVTGHRYDVVGIGNAIVDVISRESEEFITTRGLTKGVMTLVDAERSAELYGHMSPAIETSGGSAANTMAGIASFGRRAAYIGKVRDDQLGTVFRHDIRATGVTFDVASGANGLPTARCLIVVTPDAARTMNTHLGISQHLDPTDIDEELVAVSKVLYCEGYIWDIPRTKEAIRHAIDVAHGEGNAVSFTLSDTFCVERHLPEWHELLDGPIDILFGNEHEFCVLTGTDDPAEALEKVRGRCDIVAMTRGARGSVIITADETIDIEAAEIDGVVDTTGAGDMYAAGFLAGWTAGEPLKRCGELASLAAAEVIGHLGARPATPLDQLACDHLGVALAVGRTR
jgi:sugar/nucleoside kinase (ribokinase family)